MILTNSNLILVIIVVFVAFLAIAILYSIIFPPKDKKEQELQLTTKNVLEQVKILFEKGEYAIVELLASEYLNRVPSHQEVRKYLAKAYFNQGKYNNAIKQCTTVLKKEPNEIDIQQLLGKCYIKKDYLGKAVQLYETIFEKRSRDKDVVKTLAELYRDTEQPFSAISVYGLLATLVTDNQEIMEVNSILAELNEEAHDYPAAFEAYKTCLEVYPTDIDTNKKLIKLYIKIKNQAKAIDTLVYTLTFVTDPKELLWIHETLVDLYVETEEWEKAIEYSEKELEIQGSDKFKIRNNIANFNIKLDNYGEGIAILEELVMISEKGYGVTVELAKAYIKQKEYQKALDKYLELLDKSTQKEAKEIRTLVCDLYITWACDCSEKQDYDNAYKYLRNAGEYNPLNPEIYYNTAINKIAEKQVAESIEYLQKSLEYDKQKTNQAKYLVKLAEAHHILGNFFEEKRALTDLLKIDEKNPRGLYRTGMLYASQQETKKAEEFLLKAIEVAPDALDVKYNLALLYENNNAEKAKKLYMEILEQDPTHEEAKRSLSELMSSDF
ncbi:MAG: tetratricopeptide repeat protein [bacterium]|nr:tetratricopeptide repeat protein [bacterium]